MRKPPLNRRPAIDRAVAVRLLLSLVALGLGIAALVIAILLIRGVLS
jgi:hypothetical protein